MAQFTVMKGSFDPHPCEADRVPVAGEIMTINKEEWTVGAVHWEQLAKQSSIFLHAYVSLYKDVSKGQGPVYEKPQIIDTTIPDGEAT